MTSLWRSAAIVILSLAGAVCYAQTDGVSSNGLSGSIGLPSARVLPKGSVAGGILIDVESRTGFVASDEQTTRPLRYREASERVVVGIGVTDSLEAAVSIGHVHLRGRARAGSYGWVNGREVDVLNVGGMLNPVVALKYMLPDHLVAAGSFAVFSSVHVPLLDSSGVDDGHVAPEFGAILSDDDWLASISVRTAARAPQGKSPMAMLVGVGRVYRLSPRLEITAEASGEVYASGRLRHRGVLEARGGVRLWFAGGGWAVEAQVAQDLLPMDGHVARPGVLVGVIAFPSFFEYRP